MNFTFLFKIHIYSKKIDINRFTKNTAKNMYYEILLVAPKNNCTHYI